MTDTDTQWGARTYKQGLAHVAAMTLAEATSLRRADLIACACAGGPLCCYYTYRQAEDLARAAHITIKLVADTIGSEGRIRTGG